MKLIIIRHGDPDYSIDSLTEKGWREANLLSDRLMKINPDHIYCSPYGRAQDTAKPYLEKSGKTFTVCDWLKEFNGKIKDAKTGAITIPWDQLPSAWTGLNDYYDVEKWIKTPVMQSSDVKENFEYVCKGLDELLESLGYRREGNFYRVIRENRETTVLFCHFGVECVLLAHLLNVSPMVTWHSFVALPSSVTVFNTEEREKGIAYFRCASFGNLSHLYVSDEPASFSGRYCETYSSDERH